MLCRSPDMCGDTIRFGVSHNGLSVGLLAFWRVDALQANAVLLNANQDPDTRTTSHQLARRERL
ncbi:MAG: hypothetical protein ACI9DC_004260 [Gammaproteobacteria bacterium]|jgi:hypothetical protein